VQPLRTVAHTEHPAELAEAPRRQPISRRQEQLVLSEASMQRANALPIVGIVRVEAAVALAHTFVRRAVDVVGRTRDRRKPAGEVRLAQSFRRDRQIRADAETAEALAENAPAVDAELLPDLFRVAHDRVGAVQLEVRGLLLRSHSRQRVDRRRTAGPALVEE